MITGRIALQSKGGRNEQAKILTHMLVHQVKELILQRYWLEDGLLYAKGGFLFVPNL
jgi:hypothetical protein